jgi:glycosyltransferase involved in cell wall biosynthesis
MSPENTHPTVSVIIATYNMARFLPHALESALAQTYEAIEVQVVDDGSTDDTRHVLDPFLTDPRVRYHYQDNGGQASAKNRGIQEAGGEIVGFLDADDMWMTQKLERQLPLFAEQPQVGVVYSRLQEIDESGNPLGVLGHRLHRGWVTKPLFVRNFVGFNTALVRKACLEEADGFDETLGMGIDWDLWLRISTRHQFDYVNEALTYYRVWDGQMSRNFEGRYRSAFRIMSRFLAEHPDLLDPPTVRQAWADSFVNRGRLYAHIAHSRSAALRDYLRSLRQLPTYRPAWKAIAKLVISR